MKKTYSIYEHDFKEEWDKELLIEFDSEKEAEEFCMISNLPYRHERFFYRENIKYNTLSEYIKHNKSKYIKLLQKVIDVLEYKLDCIEENKELFNVKLDRPSGFIHHAPLYIIKSIVENGSKNLNRTIYQDNREIKLTCKDYPTYVEKYNKILNSIAKDKKLLAKYKKQLKLLVQKSSEKEDQNENIL